MARLPQVVVSHRHVFFVILHAIITKTGSLCWSGGSVSYRSGAPVGSVLNPVVDHITLSSHSVFGSEQQTSIRTLLDSRPSNSFCRLRTADVLSSDHCGFGYAFFLSIKSIAFFGPFFSTSCDVDLESNQFHLFTGPDARSSYSRSRETETTSDIPILSEDPNNIININAEVHRLAILALSEILIDSFKDENLRFVLHKTTLVLNFFTRDCILCKFQYHHGYRGRA